MISDETLNFLAQIAGRPVPEIDVARLFLQLSMNETFPPNALIAELLDAIQVYYADDEDKRITIDDPGHILSDVLARDKHTGFYTYPALRSIYLDFAVTRASLPNQEKKNFLIMGDYFNLSSVNDAIGRSATNDLMATICGIYVDTLTRAGVVDCLYHRSMGDEVTIVAVNTDLQKVQNGLQMAETLTLDFIRSMGLERLRHKKYPRHTGAGMVTAMMPLRSDSNHKVMKQQLDEDIQNQKKTISLSGWNFMRRIGVEPHQFHTRASEQRVDRTLHKYRIYRLNSEFNSDIHHVTNLRSGLGHATKLLIGRSIAWPRDDRIEYLRRHHDNTKMMLRADIYNLGGLNSVYGHDGADHVKAHLVRILYATVAAHHNDEPRIFDCGGGVIDVVTDIMPQIQLHNMIRAIQSNIYHQILSLSVGGYANAYNLSFAGDCNVMLNALPHPRGDYSGTGLVMATHEVTRDYSLPEIIERLDKISNRTKMHHMAYLSHDENNIVWGLPLNDAAEPIEIGADRINPGPHYLPFTDALRDYLRPQDLPNIFERPVGQICEILFGTDMQAVLGFKKAIRLLQEKNITNSEIETIDTYVAMDALLKKLKLPPLSVVSTQNRPAIIRDEPPAFRTMALAEKLEDLPPVLTDLIVQTQACFRILRLTQLHGHLPPKHAASVLKEELGTPMQETFFSDCIYRLARLFDRCYSTLGRDLPKNLQQVFTHFSADVLETVSLAFDRADETVLARKIQSYIREKELSPHDVPASIHVITEAIPSILQKLSRKKLLDADEMLLLEKRFNTLLLQLKNDIQRQSPLA